MTLKCVDLTALKVLKVTLQSIQNTILAVEYSFSFLCILLFFVFKNVNYLTNQCRAPPNSLAAMKFLIQIFYYSNLRIDLIFHY